MFCEACGTRLESGTLICSSCGAYAEPSASAPTSAINRAETSPQRSSEVAFDGPACSAHPGLPLVGTCPRCSKPVCIRCAPDAARDRFTCTDCVGLSASHPPAPPASTCALHPERTAAFICKRCGSFGCAACAAGQEGRCVRCNVSVGVPASVGARFFAHLIDNMVVVGVFIVFILAAVTAAEEASRGTVILSAMLAGLVAGCGLQIAAQLHWRQSIGKRLLGIKVVRVNGEEIELWRLILLRNVAIHVLAQATGFVGLVDSVLIFTKDRRCLHDHFANSVVIEVPDDARR